MTPNAARAILDNAGFGQFADVLIALTDLESAARFLIAHSNHHSSCPIGQPCSCGYADLVLAIEGLNTAKGLPAAFGMEKAR